MRNVNRHCFYSNSSLGGSLSRLILSVIKALLGEGMKTRRGSRQRWAKGGQRAAGGARGRTWRWRDGQRKFKGGLMREYVKGGERSPGACLSISGGPALAATHMSGPARRSVLCLSRS